MAWTMSAAQRQSFAVRGAPTAHVLRTIAATASKSFGATESQRTMLLSLAAMMTIAGTAAPHIPASLLSLLLFASGAALAIHVLNPARRAPADASAPTVKVAPATDLVFSELCGERAARTALDRAAWARLTAHMSHEFRTPLNAVLGFSELMSSEAFGPIGSRYYGDYARSIHDSGRKLLKSAEDALAITALLTAPERKGPAPVSNMTEMLDEALRFHASRFADRGIRTELRMTSSGEVIAEPQTVRQTLINLLADAESAASDGATLIISASSRPHATEFSIMLADAETRDGVQPDAFPLLLARTLCELAGAKLTTSHLETGHASWTVDYVPAVQADLFAAA